MTVPHGFHAIPGAELLSGDTDPDIRAENECRQIGATHFCAASSLSLGHVGAQATNDTGIGLVFVTNRGGEHGLSVALTPKAMRGLSAALLEMADMVERQAIACARDVIARAAGAGK